MDANRIIGRPKAYNMGYRLLSPGDNLLEPKSTRNHRLRAAQKRQANRQEGEEDEIPRRRRRNVAVVADVPHEDVPTGAEDNYDEGDRNGLEQPADLAETDENSDDDDDFFEDAVSNVGDLSDGEASSSDDVDDEWSKDDDDQQTGELIHPSLSLSKGELLSLLLAFYVRHNLSRVCLNHLLDIFNLAIPGCVPGSLYYFDKIFKCDKGKIDLHYVCPHCQSYMGKLGQPGGSDLRYCTYCDERFESKSLDKMKSYFLSSSIISQLKDMLQSTSLWDSIQKFKEKQTSCDDPTARGGVNTGYMYNNQPWLTSFLSETYNFTCAFSTDGIRLFRSSHTEIWPIFITINELGFRQQSEHLVLSCLWFGNGKPRMETFFHPFIEEANVMFKEGFEWIRNGTSRLSKVAFLIGIFDAPVRAVVQNTNQYNGKFGCGWCLAEGKRVEKGAGYMRCYPLTDPLPDKRTHHTTLQQAEEVLRLENVRNVMGVKGPSILCLLPHYDVILGTVPDFMHAALLGVTNQFLHTWLSSVGSDYYIKKPKWIDDLLEVICPPIEIRRSPRGLEKYLADYKASELRNWLIFYSPVILKHLLPGKYYFHWMLLVRSFRLVLRKTVTLENRTKAKLMLFKFIDMVPNLYGEQHCTYNVHILQHIAEAVENWGAPWAYSSFLTEDSGGFLKKLFTGPTYVAEQIFQKFLCRKYFRAYARLYVPFASDSVRELYEKIDGPLSIKSLSRTKNFKLCGVPSRIRLSASDVIAIENKLSCNLKCRNALAYKRVNVNDKLFATVDYCAKYKRNNSIVSYGPQNEFAGEIVKILWIFSDCNCNDTRDLCALDRNEDIRNSDNKYNYKKICLFLLNKFSLENVPRLYDEYSEDNLSSFMKRVGNRAFAETVAVLPKDIKNKCVMVTNSKLEQICIKVDIRFEKD